MGRKLVSIQEISNLEPIEGADRIEVASILGWKVVVQKGQFKVGDRVVYCEIDSFLPVKPEFEFLRSRCFKKMVDQEGFRIKTVRLKGQVSQGIVFPVSILPFGEFKLDEDVTKALGIVKYEPPMPACLKGIAKGSFPDFLLKSDETRAQVIQAVLRRHKGTICYVSEKINGSSATYYAKDNAFGVCSRNLELAISENAYWKWAKDNDMENKLLATKKNVMLQGEIFGQGISGNQLRQVGVDVRFFNAFDIDNFRYYDYQEFKDFIAMLGFKTVPILDDNYVLTNNIIELVKLSIGKSVINPNVWREGIVIRPLKEVSDLEMSKFNFTTARFSFKVINPEHLLNDDEDEMPIPSELN